jgi:general secretion pathway protein G
VFRTDTGRYPTTDEGLDALYSQPPDLEGWKGPYVTKVIDLDPWGSHYIYECAEDGTSFTITSYGADRKPGGEGRAADVTVTGDDVR